MIQRQNNGLQNALKSRRVYRYFSSFYSNVSKILITTKIFKINGDTQNNYYKLNQQVFYRIHKHEKYKRQFSENKNINIYIDIDKMYASLLSNNFRELLVSIFLLLYSFSLGDFGWIQLTFYEFQLFWFLYIFGLQQFGIERF